MNRTIHPAELATMLHAGTMTRREKLLRFAQIVRAHPKRFYIFNNLENARDYEAVYHPASAFALAAQDQILKDAGLESETVGAAKRFFQLSRADLHNFSCDCGGEINNTTMADRIEAIAGPR